MVMTDLSMESHACPPMPNSGALPGGVMTLFRVVAQPATVALRPLECCAPLLWVTWPTISLNVLLSVTSG